MYFYYNILFILWLLFWSFSSVLISRWKNWQWGIMLWRSECPECKHILWASELIPLLSWISQGWHCKNCKKNIPAFYPLVELFMWCMFVWSGWIALSFWYLWSDLMWWIFMSWGFVTSLYIVYDIRYMEIPDQALIPWILISMLTLILWYMGQDYRILFDYSSYQNFHTFLTDHILSAVFLYSFFFLQILITWSIFLYKNKIKDHIPSLFLS